jgi:hypothetical protein
LPQDGQLRATVPVSRVDVSCRFQRGHAVYQWRGVGERCARPAPGSSITVLSDSLVKFQGSSVAIEHGGVRVSTSRGIGTTAGDVKVLPASYVWTEFNVTDVDGTVRIAARKGDLTISDGKETFTLAQGQETTRDETSSDNDKDNKDGKKKNKKRAAGASPGASGGVFNSPVAIGIGAGAIIGVTTWVLVKNDNPASPTKP